MSTETKHTPGPWRYYTSPQPNGCPIIGARRLIVAQLAHSVNEPGQQETAIANARLIAAAPELLTALQAICEMQADHYGDGLTVHIKLAELCEKARAAIAKAKGDVQ